MLFYNVTLTLLPLSDRFCALPPGPGLHGSLTNEVWQKGDSMTSTTQSLKNVVVFHLLLWLGEVALGTQLPRYKEAQATRKGQACLCFPTNAQLRSQTRKEGRKIEV